MNKYIEMYFILMGILSSGVIGVMFIYYGVKSVIDYIIDRATKNKSNISEVE